jgi:hypothetical protein
MATPLYDALVDKVRDWSNKKEAATIPDSVIEDCLEYSADLCYSKLRIPPLEHVVTYTITSSNNTISEKYSTIELPSNLVEFIYIRKKDTTEPSYVFNEVTDSRTFLDPYADKYSIYHYMWLNDEINISPQLNIGDTLEIAYYRRLPDLNATYTVVPVNYLVGVSNSLQPYLTVDAGGTALYFGVSGGVTQCFATQAEAELYDDADEFTSETFVGKESPNWLRDSKERLLIWGALSNVGAYLFDDKMEQRYTQKFVTELDLINDEEKKRRARGGNVQMHFNANGLI